MSKTVCRKHSTSVMPGNKVRQARYAPSHLYSRFQAGKLGSEQWLRLESGHAFHRTGVSALSTTSTPRHPAATGGDIDALAQSPTVLLIGHQVDGMASGSLTVVPTMESRPRVGESDTNNWRLGQRHRPGHQTGHQIVANIAFSTSSVLPAM